MTYILLEFLKPKVNFRFNLKKKKGKKTKKSLRYLQTFLHFGKRKYRNGLHMNKMNLTGHNHLFVFFNSCTHMQFNYVIIKPFFL